MSEYLKRNAKMINEIEGREAIKTDDNEYQSMKDKVNEQLAKLEQGLKEVFESDNYKKYLNTMAKFHNYSINNTLLINQQMPEATLVAGFNSWKNNFDRHIKKGEKGIKIIAPAPYTIKKEQEITDPKTGETLKNFDGTPKTTEVEIKVPAFKISYVYDISQTEGKELPSLGVNELKDNVNHAKDFVDSLKKISPIPIKFGETHGDSKGFYSLTENAITVKEGMSESQTIKTMVHEISHAVLHNPEKAKENANKSKGTIEMEAESIAYIVCQHFGIDTSDYSFGYIAGWSEGKETKELKESMNDIRETASEMIYRIEGNLRALEKDRQKETAKEEKKPDQNEKKTEQTEKKPSLKEKLKLNKAKVKDEFAQEFNKKIENKRFLRRLKPTFDNQTCLPSKISKEVFEKMNMLSTKSRLTITDKEEIWNLAKIGLIKLKTD